MSDARAAALKAAAMKFLADRVIEAKHAANAAVMDFLDAGDRKGAVLPDGGDIGTVSVAKGRKTVKVVDEVEFLEWVRKHSPQNVYEQVRPAYVKSLAENGEIVDGMVVDSTTGEVVPGLEQTTGNPYVAVRQSDDQVAILEAALADGRIDLQAILAGPRELEQ